MHCEFLREFTVSMHFVILLLLIGVVYKNVCSSLLHSTFESEDPLRLGLVFPMFLSIQQIYLISYLWVNYSKKYGLVFFPKAKIFLQHVKKYSVSTSFWGPRVSKTTMSKFCNLYALGCCKVTITPVVQSAEM